jgi:hypothetical protein
VDGYLRDNALALVPLHPKQHTYHAGKSMDIALRQFIVRAEKANNQQETAVGVFRDKE